MEPRYDLAALRRSLPILETMVPMNACSQAPQSVATRSAAERFLESWNRDGMDWDAWVGEVEAARRVFARLVGAHEDEVAVAASVSQAVASFAGALDFTGPRDGVVLTEAEFPTVGHAWGARARLGARLSWVPASEGAVDPERVVAAIDGRTRVVSVTHASYESGAILDLSPIVRRARDRGAVVFVDAYQTLGARVVDVKALGVDALASGNLKYLMGLPGVAFLYVRRELAEKLEPTVTGWFGRADPFAFDARDLAWAPGARRFDLGTPPILPAYVARAGMELLLDAGLEAVEAWNRHLTRHLVAGAERRGLRVMGRPDADAKTPNTAIAVTEAHAVEAALRERGVIGSARGAALRLAPHFYSTTDDVDTALDALVDVLHGRDEPPAERP